MQTKLKICSRACSSRIYGRCCSTGIMCLDHWYIIVVTDIFNPNIRDELTQIALLQILEKIGSSVEPSKFKNILPLLTEAFVSNRSSSCRVRYHVCNSRPYFVSDLIVSVPRNSIIAYCGIHMKQYQKIMSFIIN